MAPFIMPRLKIKTVSSSFLMELFIKDNAQRASFRGKDPFTGMEKISLSSYLNTKEIGTFQSLMEKEGKLSSTV